MLIGSYLRSALLACVLLISLCVNARADKVVYLSSIEWPPYTGQFLNNQGESSKLVRAAFAMMGYKVEIIFVPWKRAMRMADTDMQVAGFFPEYYSEERAEKYIFSAPFGCSPVGLLMQRDKPLEWKSVDDLSGHRIGFVSGYVNTLELDLAIANGTITADYAPYDESNILKVATGRIRAAVIDPHVYRYLAQTSPKVKKYSDRLEVHPDNFGVNELYIAFRRDRNGENYARIFNEGLEKIRGSEGMVPCKDSGH